MWEHINGKNKIWRSFFFFPWDYVLNHHQGTTVVSIAAFFFKKAAIIIATHGQKALLWQLSKVILSGMYN